MSETANVLETQNALRAASDALMRDLTELQALEQEKREIAPDNPRLVRLAEEIEALAVRVVSTSMRQRERAEQISALPDAATPDRSIEQTQREIHVILAEWRDTERQLSEAAPGSAEEGIAQRRIEALRQEYHRAHEVARHKVGEGPEKV